MKKPVILWIVAALFLFCSFPFFGEGNIGAGVTGIVIAAALGVFGYVTMKRRKPPPKPNRRRRKPKQGANPKKKRAGRNMRKRTNF